jgi:lantibiotic biosynthesis protein
MTAIAQAPGPWQPILHGSAKEAALDAVRSIADSLQARRLRPDWPHRHASVMIGASGMALLYAYLARVMPESGANLTAASLLEEAFDLVASEPMDASLFHGFTGVGWTVAHLRHQLFDPADDDPAEAVDEALLELLNRPTWEGSFDLTRGLTGMGLYALERLPHPAAAAILTRVVDHLDAIAEQSSQGITWFTPPGILPGSHKPMFPKGYYDLGVAHGVPGVVAFLGSACAKGSGDAKARRLLDGAVAWLLAHRQPEGRSTAFHGFVGPDGTAAPARSAWCYGDPGLSAVLLGAARAVGDPTWEQEAVAVARLAARRPLKETEAENPGFCHGTAGLGHIFNRLYQATGDPVLGQAAREWFERTLAMRRPGRGIGGYPAWWAGQPGEVTTDEDPSLLTGAAGIALCLLAATSSVAPTWDRFFLTAIPPRAGAVPAPAPTASR